MAKGKLDGGVPVGEAQFHVTGGNIIQPVCGLQNDAGLGKPPAPGAYGAPERDASFPEGSKMPSGNAKAMGAFFGSKNPGGGK